MQDGTSLELVSAEPFRHGAIEKSLDERASRIGNRRNISGRREGALGPRSPGFRNALETIEADERAIRVPIVIDPPANRISFADTEFDVVHRAIEALVIQEPLIKRISIRDRLAGMGSTPVAKLGAISPILDALI